MRPIMMKFITTIAFVILALTPLAHAQSKPQFPAGWKPATKSDYSDENLSFRKNQVPNHIEGDFNDDGIKDQAWILINTSQKTFGVFVFLGAENGSYKMIMLDEHKRETEKLFMGISLLEPGQYKTACGKGYWECKEDETEILTLRNPGINYFAFESANSVFYWNSRKSEFTRIWMSD
jgi:hypothetical protein